MFGGGQQPHASKPRYVPNLRGCLAVRSHHDAQLLAAGHEAIDQALRETTIVEVGKDQEVAACERWGDAVKHLVGEFPADIVLPQMAYAQQGLAAGAVALLERGRA